MYGPSKRSQPNPAPTDRPRTERTVARVRSPRREWFTRTSAIAWESPRNPVTRARIPHEASRCRKTVPENAYSRIAARGITPKPNARTARSVIAGPSFHPLRRAHRADVIDHREHEDHSKRRQHDAADEGDGRASRWRGWPPDHED